MTNTTTARKRRDVMIRLEEREIAPMVSERLSHRAFFGVSALLFAVSATATFVWCTSMPDMDMSMNMSMGMGGMPMPICGAMPMTWMRMPGQTWLGAALSFIGMWAIMMIAMMLPSLVPMLWRYRQAAGRTFSTIGKTRLGLLTSLVGAGYFFVWTMLGLAVYALGVTLTAVQEQLPALTSIAPFAAGAVVLFAGALQFTSWKAHHLACCRNELWRDRTLPVNSGAAWRDSLRLGLRLGLDCCLCCAGLTAILLVIGIMNLWAMAAVTIAITAERLLPAGDRIAQVIGVVAVGTGLVMIGRAAGLA